MLTNVNVNAIISVHYGFIRGYMKKILLEMVQVFLLWMIFTIPSSAENLSNKIVRDKENVIHFGASISEDSFAYLQRMYKLKPFDHISVTSNGGDYDAGMKIAQMVYQKNISVYVPRYCASACTFIFFGAKLEQRDIAPNALLGLHNVSFGITNDIDTKSVTVTVHDAMDFAQRAVVRSAMMISFYSANGIPSDVLLQVSQTYGSSVVNVQRGDLVRWGAIQEVKAKK